MMTTVDLKPELLEKVEKYALSKSISKSESIRQLIDAGLQVGGDALAHIEELNNKLSLDINRKIDALGQIVVESTNQASDGEIKKQADRLAKMVYTANVDSRLAIHILREFLFTFYVKTQQMDESKQIELRKFLESQIVSMTETTRKELAPSKLKQAEQQDEEANL